MKRFWNRMLLFALALVTVLVLTPDTRVEAATLKQGSRGAEVTQLQKNLIGLGYLEGTADGKYGAGTAKAVLQFQADFGLKADGYAGTATQAAVQNAVIRLQAELKNAGYAVGTADGRFGNNTKKALQKYQCKHGLEITGAANAETWAVMDAHSPGLRGGAKLRAGPQTKQLQQALIGLGYLNGTADGISGPKTQAAIRMYQSAYGLTADGVAGADTMTSLKNTVTALQSELARRGCYSGTVDSAFGKGTQSAVKAYQRSVKLEQTGVAGPSTMKKLFGYSLGGSDGAAADAVVQTWKIYIDSMYQTGDHRTITYWNGGKKSTDMEESGCAGVSLAMGMNALLNTNKFDGRDVMQWFADHGYYYGEGTSQKGIFKYPTTKGLKTSYCDTAKTLISNLKKGAVAVAIIRDRTGDEFFTYSGSKGHYILVSGYRNNNGTDQVFVNNPLSWKSSKWFDIQDLMDNVKHEYTNVFVIISK